MGFFKKVFGGREDYPELDATNPAAQRLEPLKPALEKLTREVGDSIEVVPCSRGAFVFIGKPPKRFGAAWVEGEQVTNLKDLVEKRHIPADRMGALIENLRQAYEQGAKAPRYTTTVGGKKIVVAPSEELGRRVEEILHEVTG